LRIYKNSRRHLCLYNKRLCRDPQGAHVLHVFGSVPYPSLPILSLKNSSGVSRLHKQKKKSRTTVGTRNPSTALRRLNLPQFCLCKASRHINTERNPTASPPRRHSPKRLPLLFRSTKQKTCSDVLPFIPRNPWDDAAGRHSGEAVNTNQHSDKVLMLLTNHLHTI
jgi:hypothetical protein